MVRDRIKRNEVGLTRDPGFPVQKTLLDILEIELLAAGTELEVALQATHHPDTYHHKRVMKSDTTDPTRTVNVRSVSERNLAVSGKSARIQKDATAQMMVNRPSRMKIHAQPGLPPIPSMLCIAAAKRPPVTQISKSVRFVI